MSQSRLQKLLEFLERSGPSLYALLTRLTLDEDIAEDLMQELFISLRNSRTFDRARSPTAYARRAAINLAFDWRKRQRNSLPLDEVREPAASGDSPLGKLIQNEELEQILNAIGQLNGVSRETFVMRYIEQDSYEEIAKTLGKKPNQVRAVCSKALRRLRGSLGNDESQSPRKEV